MQTWKCMLNVLGLLLLQVATSAQTYYDNPDAFVADNTSAYCIQIGLYTQFDSQYFYPLKSYEGKLYTLLKDKGGMLMKAVYIGNYSGKSTAAVALEDVISLGYKSAFIAPANTDHTIEYIKFVDQPVQAVEPTPSTRSTASVTDNTGLPATYNTPDVPQPSPTLTSETTLPPKTEPLLNETTDFTATSETTTNLHAMNDANSYQNAIKESAGMYGEETSTPEPHQVNLHAEKHVPETFIANSNLTQTVYMIQLGAYRQLQKDKFTKVAHLGNLYISKTNTGLNKVLIGPFYTKSAADDALAAAKRKGFKGFRKTVTYVPSSNTADNNAYQQQGISSFEPW